PVIRSFLVFWICPWSNVWSWAPLFSARPNSSLASLVHCSMYALKSWRSQPASCAATTAFLTAAASSPALRRAARHRTAAATRIRCFVVMRLSRKRFLTPFSERRPDAPRRDLPLAPPRQLALALLAARPRQHLLEDLPPHRLDRGALQD